MDGALSSLRLIHGALILIQLLFGVGAVVGALGMPDTNPIAFTLYREILAGFILLLFSTYQNSHSEQDDAKDKAGIWGWVRNYNSFAVLGLVIFGNQAGFIVGIKMAGPVTASVWQSSQPIITAAICMALGLEKYDRRRLAGVILAFLGCAGMVLLSAQTKRQASEANDAIVIVKEHESSSSTAQDNTATIRYLVANLLFLANCSCSSAYVILSKRMLKLYPPLTVTAWSYLMAAVFMFFATIISSMSSSVESFLCPECPTGTTYFLHPQAYPALVYFVIFSSVISYGIMTWANQHVTGTLVMGYTVLQPVCASLVTLVLLFLGTVPSCTSSSSAANNTLDDKFCLDPPAASTLCGMAGVFAGLAIIISTEPKKDSDKNGDLSIERIRRSS